LLQTKTQKIHEKNQKQPITDANLVSFGMLSANKTSSPVNIDTSG
jgi:hypothetical protein